MKRIVSFMTALAMMLVLASCASSSFKVETDGDGVHAVATGGADGTGDGTITIDEGFGLCVNHAVNKGSFHITATDASGAVVIDKDLTDSIADMVPANGEIAVTITAAGADGTVDVIAYDVEAQAQGDAAYEEAKKEAENTGLANPWQAADDAEGAADGAGVGYFNLPENETEFEGGPVHWYEYQYMTLLAEARGAIGAADLVVRKGVKNPAEEVAYDTADVSGDYTEYASTWDVQAGDWQVTCFGNEEGRTMKAIWQSDNFSYSIMVRGQGGLYDTYGLGDSDIVALVGAIG